MGFEFRVYLILVGCDGLCCGCGAIIYWFGDLLRVVVCLLIVLVLNLRALVV